MKKKVACITSGGDASGINAALYSLAVADIELLGFHGGFAGIIDNAPFSMNGNTLRSWIGRGELYLQSGRSELPKTVEGLQKIKASLLRENITTLVVFGGDGSAQGVRSLIEIGVDAIHIPMTIDNDIYGTDLTIGHKSAVEQVNYQVKNLHQTGGNLPGRIFIMEIFGALSGQLTLTSGIVSGAHIVLLPEYDFTSEELADRIKELKEQGNEYIIILCTESAYRPEDYTSGNQGVAAELSEKLEAQLGERVRQSIPGYVQRSGDPVEGDIILAARVGDYVAGKILKEEVNFMVGIHQEELMEINLEEVTANKKKLLQPHVDLGRSLNLLIGEEV